MDKQIYVVLCRSGRIWYPTRDPGDYWSILSNVYTEFLSAGGNWDAPQTLILNGEVVDTKLLKTADAYCSERREKIRELEDSLREKHTPDWLKTL